ncbi:hypothetical protein BGP_1329 [Beggiatoa sp. PS]|nr:hypothetical protein BGP_1329 [Beggiatoa sp. PS]
MNQNFQNFQDKTKPFCCHPGNSKIQKVKLSSLCRHKELVFRTVHETFTSHGSSINDFPKSLGVITPITNRRLATI